MSDWYMIDYLVPDKITGMTYRVKMVNKIDYLLKVANQCVEYGYEIISIEKADY